MSSVVLGHSWVNRLRRSHGSSFPEDTFFVGRGGLTFNKALAFLQILVLLGSNDISACSSVGEVEGVREAAWIFFNNLRRWLPPGCKVIACGVEDRYAVAHGGNNNCILDLHKRGSNKYNKYLLTLRKQEWVHALMPLKGAANFSNASLYAVDGVHLNGEGNKKLAQTLKMHLYQ